MKNLWKLVLKFHATWKRGMKSEMKSGLLEGLDIVWWIDRLEIDAIHEQIDREFAAIVIAE